MSFGQVGDSVPLVQAAAWSNVEAVLLLLGAGALPGREDWRGRTALGSVRGATPPALEIAGALRAAEKKETNRPKRHEDGVS